MGEKETLLYLDLNGKLDVNYFQNDKIFFKMIDPEGKPMVQIGNYVFEGKYEDYLGTKVFFVEDTDHESSDNIFERQSAIHLRYLTRTAKVLRLKWRSVPTAVTERQKTNEDYMELRFRESYSKVLDKFERAELNIKDIAVKPKDNKEIPEESMHDKEEEKDIVEVEVVENDSEERERMEVDIELKNGSIGNTKHEIFKEYLRLPKKQIEQQKLYEMNIGDLVQVTDASNYPVLKQLFLENINLEDIDVQKNNFQKYVNIEKSICDGIIPEVKPSSLTIDLKNRLLHKDNFDNFTVPMKMAYLLAQLEKYKECIKETKKSETFKHPDEFGRTFIDKYRLLKQLIKNLWYNLCLNKSRSD